MDPLAPPDAATIELASTVRETGRLHAWLDEVLGPVPERVGNAVRLCLEEAVMNVIMHGYGPAAPGPIGLRLWPLPGRIAAEVVDAGPPFDWRPRPKPRAASLAEATIGGLGLTLIHTYASAVRATREDGRNRLLLLFDLDGEA